MDTAETERLCEREAESGVEQETEEEEALLEPEAEPELEPVPEVSRDDRDVHSQNWTEREQSEAEELLKTNARNVMDTLRYVLSFVAKMLKYVCCYR